MNYTIVIEPTKTGFSAYCPDIPGCIATGHTRKSVERTMAESITFHLEGLREEHRRMPRSRTVASQVAVLCEA